MQGVFPVNFVYLGGDDSKSFQANCYYMPRIGEFIIPQAGSSKVIVHAVGYKPKTLANVAKEPVMIPTVVLRELTEQEEIALRTI